MFSLGEMAIEWSGINPRQGDVSDKQFEQRKTFGNFKF